MKVIPKETAKNNRMLETLVAELYAERQSRADLEDALVEIADMMAAQDDALVELAELIEEE